MSGAGVTVSGANAVTTTTDADGRFIVEGVAGAGFTGQAVVARVFDDVTDRLGVGNGTFNVANGFVNLADIIVLPAGTFVVTSTDLLNAPTGAGVRVDLRRDSGGTAGEVIATAFTDAQSVARFDLVAPGTYFIESSDTGAIAGGRRRDFDDRQRSARHGEIPSGAPHRAGHGAQFVGTPVANATLRLTASSLFGAAAERVSAAGTDGTFSFSGVFVGTFAVSATDPVSQTTGGASGSIAQHAEVVTADVSLTPFSHLAGTVFRSDGVTPVGAGISVVARRTQLRGRLRVRHGDDRRAGRVQLQVPAAGRLHHLGLGSRHAVAGARDGRAVRQRGDAGREPDVCLCRAPWSCWSNTDRTVAAGAAVTIDAVNGPISDQVSGLLAPMAGPSSIVCLRGRLPCRPRAMACRVRPRRHLLAVVCRTSPSSSSRPPRSPAPSSSPTGSRQSPPDRCACGRTPCGPTPIMWRR